MRVTGGAHDDARGADHERVYAEEAEDIARVLQNAVVAPLAVGGALYKLASVDETAAKAACGAVDLTVQNATERVRGLPADGASFDRAAHALSSTRQAVLTGVCGPTLRRAAKVMLEKLVVVASSAADKLRAIVAMSSADALASDAPRSIKVQARTLQGVQQRYDAFLKSSAGAVAADDSELAAARDAALKAVTLASSLLREAQGKWVFSVDELAVVRLTKDVQDARREYTDLVNTAMEYLEMESEQLDEAVFCVNEMRRFLASAPVTSRTEAGATRKGWFVDDRFGPLLADVGSKVATISSKHIEQLAVVESLASAFETMHGGIK